MEFTYLHDFEFMKFPSYINDILNTVKAIQRETEWFSDELDEEEDDSFIPENDAGYPEVSGFQRTKPPDVPIQKLLA